MAQINHDECWIIASDPPKSKRRVIIWTKKPWIPSLPPDSQLVSRHLDLGGAWYSVKEKTWYHSDGHVAEGVTHYMEMPRKPR